MKRILLLTMVALAVGVLAPTVQADFRLSLDDGAGHTALVTDGGVGDSNPTTGAITWIGSLGDWTVDVTTGTSKPALGSVIAPDIDLNSTNTSKGAATLTMKLLDTDFSLPVLPDAATMTSKIGGTTIGAVTLEQILDLNNGGPNGTDFSATGTGDIDLLLSWSAPGGFAITSGSAWVTGPFSITEIVTITHPGAGQTSFDAESTVVPVPGAILLGFLGLGAAGLKLRRFA
jgi:hypothetical protein